MLGKHLLYVVPLLISGIIALYLLFIILQTKKTPRERTFVYLLMAISSWSFFFAVELILSDYSAMLFLRMVQYIAVILIPPLWLMFSYQFAFHNRSFFFKELLIVFSVPTLSIIMMLSDRFHHLFFSDILVNDIHGLTFIFPQWGFFFWVHAFFSYTAMFTGVILTVSLIFKIRHIHLKQTAIVLLGVLLPLLGNLWVVFGDIPDYFLGYDFTPVLFTFTGIFFTVALKHYKFLSFFPVARDVVFKNINNPIIMFDFNNLIVDYNTTGAELIMANTNLKCERKFIGSHISEIFTKEALQKIEDGIAKAKSFPLFFKNNNIQHYLIEKTELRSVRNDPMGSVYIFSDITERKLTLDELRKAEQKNHLLAMAVTANHEINQPLMIIKGTLDLFKIELERKNIDSDKQLKYIAKIDTAVDRIANILLKLQELEKIEFDEYVENHQMLRIFDEFNSNEEL